jgi:hypothetical protein
MAKRMTKAEKATEAAIEAAYYKFGYGIQINIMNLSKISAAGRAAAMTGASIEEAVANAITAYREN